MELYILKIKINIVFDSVICQNQADCIDDKELGCLLKPEFPEVF